MKPDPDVEETVLKPEEQRLKIRLETKQRGGKVVTIVDGYVGAGATDLAKLLKNHCGTGGSVKDQEILVQGDNREKIMQWLLKNGYKHSKKAGG